MKLFKRFARAKTPAPVAEPEQELFPAADMQETAEAEAELKAVFDALYLSSLKRRRKAVLDAFTEAAHYSPLPGPARDSLEVSFTQAIGEVSSDQQLFFQGFSTGSSMSTFIYDVSNQLRAVALNSKILPLRKQALAGIVATMPLSPLRIDKDVEFLTDLATRDAEPAVRGEAVRSLAAIATNKNIPSFMKGMNRLSDHLDIRSYDNFGRYDQNLYITNEEFVMGVAAFILKKDPDPAVRHAAAQALRDIAAANPPKYQFFAASHASEAKAFQSDARVQAVIEGIFDDSKVVNFQRHQRVPGLTL